MSISDGQNANATNFNAGFVSKTDADAKAGNLTLNNKLSLQDSGSTTMTDAQEEINDLKDEFNTSTGHDHDGSDSKKVLATNLDTTGGANGQVLKANGAGGSTWETDEGAAGAVPVFVFSTQSGDYTILDNDEFATIAFDDTSSDRTCTLPTAADNTNRRIVIKNVSTDKGKVTVDGEGAETIDTEFTTIDLDFEGAYIQVHCDGTGWFIVSENVTAARKQYALTVTGTGWTTVRAVGIPYRTLDGAWRVRFNISGSVISGVRVGYTVSIGGVVFKATSLNDQPLSGWVNGSFTNMDVYAAQGTDDIVLNHTSGTTTKYNWSGDVECDSKPTFVE